MAQLPRLDPMYSSDQRFGVCLTPQDLILPLYNINHDTYYRPWKLYVQNCVEEFGSTISNDKGTLKITLDVQQFTLNEISVKVTNEEIIIEGKHGEREDEHGFITRQFKRRYNLPNDCPSEDITLTLSSDGILTITAKKKSDTKNQDKEKRVPVELYGSYLQTEELSRNISGMELKHMSKTSEPVKVTKNTNDELLSLSDKSHDMIHSKLLKDSIYSIIENTLTETRVDTDDQLYISGKDEASLISEMLEETFGQSSTKFAKTDDFNESDVITLSEISNSINIECESSNVQQTEIEIKNMFNKNGAAEELATASSECTFANEILSISEKFGQDSVVSEMLGETSRQTSTTQTKLTEEINQSNVGVTSQISNSTYISCEPINIVKTEIKYRDMPNTAVVTEKDLCTKNTEITLEEDHCCMLNSELLKEAISSHDENNFAETMEKVDRLLNVSAEFEQSNVGSQSLEETSRQSNMAVKLTDEFNQSNEAATSEISNKSFNLSNIQQTEIDLKTRLNAAETSEEVINTKKFTTILEDSCYDNANTFTEAGQLLSVSAFEKSNVGSQTLGETSRRSSMAMTKSTNEFNNSSEATLEISNKSLELSDIQHTESDYKTMSYAAETFEEVINTKNSATLMEDHCCMSKSELLKEASSSNAENTYTKTNELLSKFRQASVGLEEISGQSSIAMIKSTKESEEFLQHE